MRTWAQVRAGGDEDSARSRRPSDRPLFRYFAGAAGGVPLAVVPDQLISQPTPLTVGAPSLSSTRRRAGKPQTR